MTSVFLSYSHGDSGAAERLEARLEIVPDLAVWRDRSSLVAGSRWRAEIERQIRHSDFFVAVLSPNYVRPNGSAIEELVYALELVRAGDKEQRFVVPVQLAPTTLPALVSEAAELHTIEFTTGARTLQSLLAALRRLAPVASDDPAAKIRLTVHQAQFRANPRLYYFVNVANRVDHRIEITHVHYRDPMISLLVRPESRPLPTGPLAPAQAWATWIGADRIPEEFRDDAYGMFEVRLSTGELYRSSKEDTMLPEGPVPGGPVELGPGGLDSSA